MRGIADSNPLSHIFLLHEQTHPLKQTPHLWGEPLADTSLSTPLLLSVRWRDEAKGWEATRTVPECPLVSCTAPPTLSLSPRWQVPGLQGLRKANHSQERGPVHLTQLLHEQILPRLSRMKNQALRAAHRDHNPCPCTRLPLQASVELRLYNF